MTSATKPVLTGGCQCGAIRFALSAAPVKVSICHCRMCQKAAGAPFASLADIEHGDFIWTRGKPAAFRSSSIAMRDFCRDCGTPLSFRRIDGRRMRREAAAVFEQLGVRLDPDRPARGLSIADQQLVEIAKALTSNARVIVMDEPTAALTTTEVERLFGVVETLRARGNAVLFVSHRLEEIFAVCQRVTVMRDGRHVLTKPVGELTRESVIRAMVGRDMEALFPKIPTEPGPVVLRVDRLTREGVFTDISFDVRSGEIVALAGLVGAGRTEVARAIFGIDRWDAGSVEIAGKYDPYVAAYLVAECAPSLMRSSEALLALIESISPAVDALGFNGLAERLGALRVALGGASTAPPITNQAA